MAAAFDFYLLNSEGEVTAGSIGEPAMLDGEVLLDIAWSGFTRDARATGPTLAGLMFSWNLRKCSGHSL